MYVILYTINVHETGEIPTMKEYGLYLSFFQVNVVTQRGFIPVDERMRVIDANGNLVIVVFLTSIFSDMIVIIYVILT